MGGYGSPGLASPDRGAGLGLHNGELGAASPIGDGSETAGGCHQRHSGGAVARQSRQQWTLSEVRCLLLPARDSSCLMLCLRLRQGLLCDC